MNPTADQMLKLPAWARKHVEELQNRMAVIERQLSDFSSKQTKSRVWTQQQAPAGRVIRDYIQQPIVHFKGRTSDFQVSLSKDGMRLRVNSVMGELQATCQAANLMELGIGDNGFTVPAPEWEELEGMDVLRADDRYRWQQGAPTFAVSPQWVGLSVDQVSVEQCKKLWFTRMAAK